MGTENAHATRQVDKSGKFYFLSEENLEEICNRIVAVDETWIWQYDPESKQESMQWIKKERPLKKFKVQKSASKLMVTVIWDSGEIRFLTQGNYNE